MAIFLPGCIKFSKLIDANVIIRHNMLNLKHMIVAAGNLSIEVIILLYRTLIYTLYIILVLVYFVRYQ